MHEVIVRRGRLSRLIHLKAQDAQDARGDPAPPVSAREAAGDSLAAGRQA